MQDELTSDVVDAIGQTTTKVQVESFFSAHAVEPPSLRMIIGPGAPAPFILQGERLVVGRSPDADLQVQSTDLSRMHMELRKTGSEYSCVDLDSSNGVFLNGVRIHSAVLRHGDRVQLGDVIFVYNEGR